LAGFVLAVALLCLAGAATATAKADDVDNAFLNAVKAKGINFATPEGGMEYLTLASGGPLHETPHVGPLAIMHRHVATLLDAGRKTGAFRGVAALDFYLIVKSVLLIRLVFRNDTLLTGKPSPSQVAETKSTLWDVARRYLAPNPDLNVNGRTRKRR